MAKYYEVHKNLLLAITLTGVYFPSIEKIYGKKFYVKSLKLLCILPGISLPLFFLSAVKYEIFDEGDTGSKIFGIALMVYSLYMSFTFYTLYYYRQEFERLFELWDSMFQEELFNENRQKLLTKNKNITDKWLKHFFTVSVLSCIGYCSVMYFTPAKKLNHPSGIPYRHQSPDFELINTFDLFFGCFGFSGIIVFDSTVMTLLSMEEAQLQHLKSCLAWIVDKISVTDCGTIQIKAVGESDTTIPDIYQKDKAFETTRKEIRVWIFHHQQLLRFHSEFQKVYSVPLSAKFSFFVLIICLTCFLSLAGTFSILEIAFSALFCLSLYIVFYVNVLFADSVTEASGSIFGEAFEKSWHLYPQDLKTIFHIIQMRSHRPLQLLAFKKYPMSSSSILKIFSSAYSLFTFMLQTNRKKIKTLELRTSSNL